MCFLQQRKMNAIPAEDQSEDAKRIAEIKGDKPPHHD